LNQFEGRRFRSEYDPDGSFFCFIPMEGNRMVKEGDKYFAYTDNDYKQEEVPEINESKCWKQLNQYLEKISKVKSLENE
jgi:hypothetical protein